MDAGDQEARQAILSHHEELVGGVRSRVAALAGAIASGRPHDTARAELVAFLASEVPTHAAAEETSLYPAASEAGLAGRIGAMVAEHRQLERAVDDLARTTDPAAASAGAAAIEDLFVRHVTAENDEVLPALVGADGVSLAGLLSQMHERYSAAKAGPAETPDQPGAEARLAAALSEALVALAQAGEADRACRLAAETWVAMRSERPALAVRLTALLHRLVRLGVAAESLPPPAPSDAEADPVLDVREVPPARRHQVIFTAYAGLSPAAGFVLVNDHDPRPLRYQFAAEHAGEFSWDYLEAGPEVWRVRIGKVPAPAAA